MLAASRSPRARELDDEVVVAGTERGDHFLDGARIVGAVAIHEHQDTRVAGSLATVEGPYHLLARYCWQVEGEKVIVVHGGGDAP